MLTKTDKSNILKRFKQIDVKKITIDHGDDYAKKWFKFGSFVGLDMAAEIIKAMPEEEDIVS